MMINSLLIEGLVMGDAEVKELDGKCITRIKLMHAGKDESFSMDVICTGVLGKKMAKEIVPGEGLRIVGKIRQEQNMLVLDAEHVERRARELMCRREETVARNNAGYMER